MKTLKSSYYTEQIQGVEESTKILVTIKKCHGHKPARELTQLTKKCQQDEHSPL